jgi:glycine/D-amino acid oxidase-like deaminating enzyme
MLSIKAPVHERAVVIGGSMVGLAVARALSETFREVIVIERDHLSASTPEHRPGVPQSWHIHNLTLRGQNELEELFPGFCAEAIALGAMQVDYARDISRCTELGWMPLFESGFVALSATRILFEFAERERFRALTRNAVVLPWHGQLSLPLSEFVMRAGHHDNEVFRALLHGIHMLKQPYELITPGFAARVAAYGLRQLTGTGLTRVNAPPEPAE